MITKHFTFKVDRCVNTTENGNYCHPAEEIDRYIKDATMRAWMVQNNAEMYQLAKDPYFISQKSWINSLLGLSYYERFILSICKVEMQTYDAWLGFGIKTHMNNFYQVHDLNVWPKVKEENTQQLFQTDIYLMPVAKKYVRKVYALSDVLSQVGGMMSLLVSVSRVITSPIGQFMFYIVAIKRLFFASTSSNFLKIDKSFNKECKIDMKIAKYIEYRKFGLKKELEPDMKKEVARHRLIRISITDTILLFFHVHCKCLNKISCWKSRAHFQKIDEDGSQRIDKDLNIIKLVKNLKRIKILVKSRLMTRDIKFKIAHSSKNCINVDDRDAGISSRIFDNDISSHREIAKSH